MNLKTPLPNLTAPVATVTEPADIKGALKGMQPLQTGVPDFFTKLHELETVKGTTGAEFTVIGETPMGLRVSVRVWLEQKSGVTTMGNTDAANTLLGVRVRLGDAKGVHISDVYLNKMDPQETCFTGGFNKGSGYRSLEGYVLIPAAPTDPLEVATGFLQMGVMPELMAAVQNILQAETITLAVEGSKLGAVFAQLIKQALEVYTPAKSTVTVGYRFGKGGAWLKKYFPANITGDVSTTNAAAGAPEASPST